MAVWELRGSMGRVGSGVPFRLAVLAVWELKGSREAKELPREP